MDQLTPAIQWIKKNVFWLGCTFLAIAMVAMWFVASGSLAKQTKKYTTDVKNKVKEAQNILNVKPEDITEGGAHPNDNSEAGMKQELSDTINSIVEAWTIRKQRQEKILVWPSVIPSKQFVAFFSKFNPPETFPERWNTGIETQQMLELYRAKIPEHMIYLCGDDVLRTRWKYDPANMTMMPNAGAGFGGDDGDDEYGDEFGGGGRGPGDFGGGGGRGPGDFGGGGGRGPGDFGGGGGGMPGMGGASGMAGSDSFVDYNKYAVRWGDSNQNLWYQKMTSFQGRDGNQFVHPTPLQCYMLQQDLWLLEAMFRIVREVNGDSNANDLSPIKTIDHVVFGREVGGQLGELTPPDQRLAGKAPVSSSPMGGMMGEFGDDGDDEMDDYGLEGQEDLGAMFSRGGKGMGAPGDFGDGPGGPGSSIPYDMLYVDVNFEPLPADVVKQVITGKELPEENLELIVAKRVPVRIALKMDERRIGDFMAACANSPFAFEIQQVRWNRHTPGGGDITLGGSSGGVFGGGDRKDMGGMGMDLGLGNSSFSTDLSTEPIEVRTSYDVHVEFYGIVKIYNPVREKELRQAAGLVEENVDVNDAAGIAEPNTNGNSSKP